MARQQEIEDKKSKSSWVVRRMSSCEGKGQKASVDFELYNRYF